MQTIKTAIVVVLLLFVLYGGYIALNHKEPQLREELTNLVDPDTFSADVDLPSPTRSPQVAGEGTAVDAFERFAKNPSPNFNTGSNPIGTVPPPALPPLPNASSSPNAGEAVGPNTKSAGQATDTSLPDVPSLELPNVEVPPLSPPVPTLPPVGGLLPKSTPNGVDAAVVPASGSRSNDAGFGLNAPSINAPALNAPNANPSASTAGLNKPGRNSMSKSEVPPLDLPSLHGNAKSIADATSPREDATNLSPDGSAPLNPRMPTSSSGKSYENAKRLALEQAQGGKLKEALAMLSVFYNAQDLTNDQHNDLVDLLDALAREVIYSRRHLLDVPYVVAPGETLEQIAKTCNVPVEVLTKINGIPDRAQLAPGMKLKTLPGPFRAEVDLASHELTLFLGDLYAGRYPVSFGTDPEPRTGVYQVLDKQTNRNYYSSNGMLIPAKDPRNPFGGYWLDLGQDICIHGSSEVDSGSSNLGCISLSPLDASDVFGMLSRGSQVSIRR